MKLVWENGLNGEGVYQTGERVRCKTRLPENRFRMVF